MVVTKSAPGQSSVVATGNVAVIGDSNPPALVTIRARSVANTAPVLTFAIEFHAF
jgi:hypothetical protein